MNTSASPDQTPAGQTDENAGDLTLDALMSGAPMADDTPAAPPDSAAVAAELGAEPALADSPPFVAKLEAATRDLLMLSETDAPFRVVYWPLDQAQISSSEVALYLTENADAPVETQGVPQFFENAARAEDWMSDDEKATAKRFAELVETIESELENPRVYRIGEREITVAAIGKVADGFGGVVTLVVET